MKRLIKKISKVPTLNDNYDSLEYEFIDIGIQTVNVNDIVGMCNGRNEEYNEDFTPKNENDERWINLKNLVEEGDTFPPIPLIKTPDGTYYGDGDGSHRISIAKTMGLQTVEAKVSVMIPNSLNIDEQWKQYAKDKINKLNELSEQYKNELKQTDKVREEAYLNNKFDEYEKFLFDLNELGDEISELDEEIRNKEQKFKEDLIKEYI